jgi:glycolate oxidase iron-sulfur subunit
MLAMLAATAADRRTGSPTHARARTEQRAVREADRLAVFSGCVMAGLFGHVHEATRVALEANGFAVEPVPAQVCCGALAAHAGDDEQARRLARENVLAFDGAAPGLPIVVNSAGCGAAMKQYGALLAGETLEERARSLAARVRDVSEVLASRGPRPGGRVALRVAYDAPCHLVHAQRVAEAPLRLLSAIDGLELVAMEGSDRCCGSAGLYSLVEPELSFRVLAAKLDAAASTHPDVLATGNPGCLMHIGAGALLRGLPFAVRHPVELLAWSYAT